MSKPIIKPETAQDIASLINEIDVAVLIRSNNENNTDKCGYWMAKEFKAIIKLTEDYGIPHASYDQAIRCMQKDMYANASLA